jgi:hypothetical protein
MENQEATNEQKKEIIEGFIILSAKHALHIFESLGLKTHIESMVIDEKTGDEYIYSFRKVTNMEAEIDRMQSFETEKIVLMDGTELTK